MDLETSRRLVGYIYRSSYRDISRDDWPTEQQIGEEKLILLIGGMIKQTPSPDRMREEAEEAALHLKILILFEWEHPLTVLFPMKIRIQFL